MEQISELTIENLVPYTYLVISGLIYLAIIMFMFYSKRKVRTIENFCYSIILWLVVSASVEDIFRLLAPLFIKNVTILTLLDRLHIILIVFILAVLTMYIITYIKQNNTK